MAEDRRVISTLCRRYRSDYLVTQNRSQHRSKVLDENAGKQQIKRLPPARTSLGPPDDALSAIGSTQSNGPLKYGVSRNVQPAHRDLGSKSRVQRKIVHGQGYEYIHAGSRAVLTCDNRCQAPENIPFVD